ncbi:MBL fold metallo-hydrolase RNA specificity domain-containing protein [Ferrovum sp. PN-J185]|uniref:MBL fold metallo-hydrolase RNA specificity domain-containing protein n=1 Tax=Ferrovum sp. PN-J185 TaxID=1356306 RepID=UPI00079A0532|nr:MBL fold metallo-hydrolase [Ferrovum sp. PN-J185]KXW56899.1 ribonuclease [Ferrovum sp. PN-J185]
MKISFHGANQDVTGSCHLLECNGTKILIDCGMFQGGRELEEENAEPFGFEPEEIDFVLLTHAHLDHCGRLPLLVKRGFKGEIITTSATRELARLVMVDAAHLQEEEALHRSRHPKSNHNHHNKSTEISPLYVLVDAFRTMDFFGRTVHYHQPFQLTETISVTFYDAGHILGSASIYISAVEDNIKKTILFSGDIGNSGRPLLNDPETPAEVDYVVMETTYGDRLHRSFSDSVNELYHAIEHTINHGGNVIIPTFALERTQEILYFLNRGIEQQQLSSSTQVFLDSPMAISATQIFERHPALFRESIKQLFDSKKDPFQLPGLHFSRETADSIAINRIQSGAVIMAGSGMCTGGRVRHHLQHGLSRSECAVVFVGYASQGTLARRIIDGAKTVRIFNEELPVRANIYTINGFSAHADQAELVNWHKKIKNIKGTFLVHGDFKVMQTFKQLIAGKVDVPEKNQIFNL